MRLLLVRHGESEANSAGYLQGRSDYPLTPRGRAQAEALGRALAGRGERPQALYTSPLRRTYETAALLGAQLGCAPQIEPDLIEVDVGAVAHLSVVEFRERFPELLSSMRSGDPAFAFPEGESMADLHRRAQRGIAAVRQRHAPGSTVLIVSHGGLLGCWIAQLLGQTGGWPGYRLKNCSLTELRLVGEVAEIVCLNDNQHVAGV